MKLLFITGADGGRTIVKALSLMQEGFAVHVPWNLSATPLYSSPITELLLADNPREWRLRLTSADAAIMMRCDGVYICADWQQSDAAKTHLLIARSIKRQLFFEGLAEPDSGKANLP